MSLIMDERHMWKSLSMKVSLAIQFDKAYIRSTTIIVQGMSI